MPKILVVVLIAVVIAACHDSEQFLPTAPEFQNALTVEPESATLPANGVATLAIIASINPAAAPAANRVIEFIATDGVFLEGATPDAKTVERTINVSGDAVAHLRSTQKPGPVQVTVRVKAKPELTKIVSITFTTVDPAGTLALSAERTTGPADDFTSTVITAKIGDGIPVASRTVSFTTTRGRFLQTNLGTASVTADADGNARVDLVGSETGSARVTATVFNVVADLAFTFVQALPETILVQPSKRQIQQGLDEKASTTVVIRMLRGAGKVTAGTVPLIRVVDAASGAELPFLIGQVTDTNAAGQAQAVITAGPTEFVGTARIEVRVNGSEVVGSETVQVIRPLPV